MSVTQLNNFLKEIPKLSTVMSDEDYHPVFKSVRLRPPLLPTYVSLEPVNLWSSLLTAQSCFCNSRNLSGSHRFPLALHSFPDHLKPRNQLANTHLPLTVLVSNYHVPGEHRIISTREMHFKQDIRELN